MSLIMSWSKCSIKIGKTGANDALATTLADLPGTIKEKSTTLEMSEGTKLQAFATGHKLVAQEELEGDIIIKTRIMEPSLETLATMLNATWDDTTKKLKVNSVVISDNYSVVITPKNVGAQGIEVRKTDISYKEGYSEDEGVYADIKFTILECADNELYTKFIKQAE